MLWRYLPLHGPYIDLRNGSQLQFRFPLPAWRWSLPVPLQGLRPSGEQHLCHCGCALWRLGGRKKWRGRNTRENGDVHAVTLPTLQLKQWTSLIWVYGVDCDNAMIPFVRFFSVARSPGMFFAEWSLNGIPMDSRENVSMGTHLQRSWLNMLHPVLRLSSLELCQTVKRVYCCNYYSYCMNVHPTYSWWFTTMKDCNSDKNHSPAHSSSWCIWYLCWFYHHEYIYI